MTYKGRDVELTKLDETRFLVAACDSCGAIGNKELDIIQASPYMVGRFTARVPLLEILAIGAEPKMVTAAITSEPDPTGREILTGIEDELGSLGYRNLPIGISSEKNVPTRQTGLGVTVVGICNHQSLRVAATKSGDNLFCIGLPKVGSEVGAYDDPTIIQGKHMAILLENQEIHDILPVGSRGIRAEANQLASIIGEAFQPLEAPPVNLDKSAGPSTCLIISCSPDYSPTGFFQVPIFKIGTITQLKKEDL